MANPASFTITPLVANSAITASAGQAVDTTGTVPIAAAGKMDRLWLRVTNGSSTVALTVAVKAGIDPPGYRSGIGDLSVTVPASGVKLIGPLESARFVQAGGAINLAFTPASGSPNATVEVYRLPIV